MNDLVKEQKVHFSLFGGFALLLLLLMGCRPSQELAVSYSPIPNAEWERGASVEIPFLVTEAGRTYRMDILLRHNNMYDYNHIVLQTVLTNQWGYKRVDTLSLPLAVRSGVWAGKGVALRENAFVFLPQISFPSSGMYTLSITPITPLPVLKGIENVGMVCQPFKNQSNFLGSKSC